MRALALLLVSLASALATPHWHPPRLPSMYMVKPHRDLQQRKLFMLMTGYPHGRPGFQVDHRLPLKRGGIDAWWNMQWLSDQAKYLKDRWE